MICDFLLETGLAVLGSPRFPGSGDGASKYNFKKQFLKNPKPSTKVLGRGGAPETDLPNVLCPKQHRQNRNLRFSFNLSNL